MFDILKMSLHGYFGTPIEIYRSALIDMYPRPDKY